MVDIVGVSKVRTSGAYVTKTGRKSYRGEKKHWYVYYYDDENKFRKKMISALEVPYYGSLIRRTKSYLCKSCGTKFRSMKADCPKCGSKGTRLERGGPRRRPELRKPQSDPVGHQSGPWYYQGSFVTETAKVDAPTSQRP